MKSTMACVRQRWGKRRVLQKIVKVYLLRITGMYTLVMAAVFHGRNPVNKTAIQECPPSNAFHPATMEECHLRHIYIGCPHDFCVMTKVENLSHVSM
jgi:hypothetical protein